jgi:hypothetical protein
VTPSTVVVGDEVVVASSTVVATTVVTIETGNVVDGVTDVEGDVEVGVMAVLESFPPNESVKIKPTISITTKALAPIAMS